MLHVVVWSAIYSLILLLLGYVTQPWRDRSWFKVLLFPGTVLATAVQVGASYLCFASRGRISLVGDKKPAFEVDAPRIAYVPGGFFVLISHAFLFTVYLFVAGPLHDLGIIDAHALRLPDVYPLEILEGRLELDLRDSVDDTSTWTGAWRAHPWSTALFCYVSLAVFASMGICSRLWRHGTAVLIGIGSVAYIGGWFGAGFKLFGRGWWARLLYFPDWWAKYSLFVLLAVTTLALASALRATPWALAHLRDARKGPPPPGSSSSKKSKKSPAKRKSFALSR